MPYAWHIDNDELKPLFEKQLSKHSVGAYMKLYVEVGHSFWAVRSQHGEKLKLSEEYSAEVSQRKTELEFEVSNLQDAINASNSIISNYQQEIQQWTSTVKYYEAYCHQCTDELNQVISSLQRLKDCFAPIMCGEVIEF
ncbi:unnamed protein product [Aspergillus oryzae]|uniref:Unnamed protein product n=1 Tax=Aspergillus oryzae TaxID=5062 RepID=A0AAN5C582_ASPOZ|nr:unnamed protein product [Aspergillus oryzae]GMG38578.1 unnamed protein product [Aspergillus oryzae]